MQKEIIFDLDDFCDKHNILPKLDELKKLLPLLKVTLFTIPQKTSMDLIKETCNRDWIQLAIHSFKHNDNYECSQMTYEKAKRKLEALDMTYYVRGFKPAGWQISHGVMCALKELDFWLAVQYSDGRMNKHPDGPYQPAVIEGLRYYALNEVENYEAIHGHCQNVCGNGLEELWGTLIKIDPLRGFKFIDEVVGDRQPKEVAPTAT